MCKVCKELNEEKERISVEGIYISNARYYNYNIPIIHCPKCGNRLNRYKDLTDEQIENCVY